MTDDIPEDVMEAAREVWRNTLAIDVDDFDTIGVIARAILAEREACANIADSMECMTCIAKTNGGDDSKIAQAIRSRK